MEKSPGCLQAMNFCVWFLSLGERKHKAETSAFLIPLCENNLKMLMPNGHVEEEQSISSDLHPITAVL